MSINSVPFSFFLLTHNRPCSQMIFISYTCLCFLFLFSYFFFFAWYMLGRQFYFTCESKIQREHANEQQCKQFRQLVQRVRNLVECMCLFLLICFFPFILPEFDFLIFLLFFLVVFVRGAYSFFLYVYVRACTCVAEAASNICIVYIYTHRMNLNRTAMYGIWKKAHHYRSKNSNKNSSCRQQLKLSVSPRNVYVLVWLGLISLYISIFWRYSHSTSTLSLPSSSSSSASSSLFSFYCCYCSRIHRQKNTTHTNRRM